MIVDVLVDMDTDLEPELVCIITCGHGFPSGARRLQYRKRPFLEE